MKSADQIKDYYRNRLEECAEDDLFYQVGKTQYGEKVTADQIDLIANVIQSGLHLSKNDRVLDIGCANGLISYKISEKVQDLTGIDLSNELIQIAIKLRSRSNISYFADDIFTFNFKNTVFNKIYMYEVLQHFPYSNFRELLLTLKSHLKSFRLFIGGVPDAEGLFNFYNDEEKRKFYFSSLEQGAAHLGNWWYAEHLKMVCDDLNLSFEKIEQNPNLYTAHYRFDCVVWTKDNDY